MHKISIEHGLISIIAGNPIKGELLLGGNGWTCAMHRIEPKVAHALAADLIKAAESIDPSLVKIERWLTAEDRGRYGDKWEWWSKDWDNESQTPKPGTICQDTMLFQADDGMYFDSFYFTLGDYFTPIKGEK